MLFHLVLYDIKVTENKTKQISIYCLVFHISNSESAFTKAVSFPILSLPFFSGVSQYKFKKNWSECKAMNINKRFVLAHLSQSPPNADISSISSGVQSSKLTLWIALKGWIKTVVSGRSQFFCRHSMVL